jgi:hypothetical protein
MLNGAATVSALLLVATCVLWALSRLPDRMVSFGRANGRTFECDVGSDYPGAGRLTIFICNPWPHRPYATLSGPSSAAQGVRSSTVEAWWPSDVSFAGVECSSGLGRPTLVGNGRVTFDTAAVLVRYYQWTAPCWMVAVTTGLPASFIAGAKLRRRLQRHRGGSFNCVSCGYDLRATSDRCPECGTVPTVSSVCTTEGATAQRDG